MDWRVLVLDVAMQPVDVIDWTIAMQKWSQQKVEVIEERPDVEIRTSRITIRLPSIVILKKPHKRRKVVQLSRRNILIRDEFVCQYCGKKFKEKDLSLDHVIPKMKRTPESYRSWTNLVTACYPCNQKKAGRTPKEAGMRLMREPIKPAWLPQMTIKISTTDPLYPIWKPYLDWDEK